MSARLFPFCNLGYEIVQAVHIQRPMDKFRSNNEARRPADAEVFGQRPIAVDDGFNSIE